MIEIQEIFDKDRGVRARIARALNITHGAVSQWRQVPPQHVTLVSEMVKLAPHVLRPDVFPSPQDGSK